MKDNFDKALDILTNTFGKDMTLPLATSTEGVPTIRYVDTYFFKDSFYIVTHRDSLKMKQIIQNENVSLCYRLHNFSGKAIDRGHPLLENNKEIRDILIKEFSTWYFQHNNEEDPKMCYLEIKLSKAFTYDNGLGYKIDFNEKKAEEFPFSLEIIPIT